MIGSVVSCRRTSYKPSCLYIIATYQHPQQAYISFHPTARMCAQDHTSVNRMRQTYDNGRLATSTRRPALTRMPKTACLATAGRFSRTRPTVSAYVAAPVVSQPTQTSPSCNTTLCNQLAMSSPCARPVLAVSNDLACQHRRCHALVQGRLIPFCLRCGDAKERNESLAVASSQSAPTLSNQLTMPSRDVRPALVVVNHPMCQHRRSHAHAQGRWISICLRCSDDEKIENPLAVASSQDADANTTIAASALPMLHTMQGFPFDLRRSQPEASRLME